jgi:hypothetical protein
MNSSGRLPESRLRRGQMPTRSRSVEAYLRQTRAGALVAGGAFVAALVLDEVASRFWSRHALLASLVASLIVVLLTVAVVNEAQAHRQRQRWRVLAQYVMLQLVRHARMVWMAIAELADMLPADDDGSPDIERGAAAVRDTERLRAAVRGLLGEPEQRRRLQDTIAGLAEHSDEVLGRWADVMLNADGYAEIIDRHVELASGIAWLEGALDNFEPPDDVRRWHRSRANPAIQLTRNDEDAIVERLVAVTQLAERLDRRTLDLAERLVPHEWWTERLSPRAPEPDLDQPAEYRPA